MGEFGETSGLITQNHGSTDSQENQGNWEEIRLIPNTRETSLGWLKVKTINDDLRLLRGILSEYMHRGVAPYLRLVEWCILSQREYFIVCVTAN